MTAYQQFQRDYQREFGQLPNAKCDLMPAKSTIIDDNMDELYKFDPEIEQYWMR